MSMRSAVRWLMLALYALALDAVGVEVAVGDEPRRETPLRAWLQEREGGRHHQAAITGAGDYTLSLQHDGLERRYRVHIPAGYSSEKPLPLLLAFHGGGGDMNHMANDDRYGLISASESLGFVVVFPSGISPVRSGKLATWNAGRCCAAARDQQIDDVGFVRQLLAQLKQQIAVDEQRIFAAGMSNGGMMAYRLACEMADTFRAVAAVAGTDNTLSCEPQRPISVLHIHARNDDRVLYGGGAGDAFRDRRQVTDFTSVDATVAKWVAKNGCGTAPRRVLSSAGAYCDRYERCQAGASVQLCVTDSGGHSWPGGHKPRGEAPSTAISANQVMWDFFGLE